MENDKFMTESRISEVGLVWALPARSRFVYEYTHHRVVTTGPGKKCEGVADRLADLVVTVDSQGATGRVTLTNIDDTGTCSDSDERIERPTDRNVYPVIVFDRTGRILENASPPTFPLTFSPELAGLTQGSTRSFDFEAPFKSGFGRCTACGTVTTCWKSTEIVEESRCAILVTTFDLQSVPGGYPWSPGPPRFRGRTIVHFDLDAGRLALLASTSQLEQTIGWQRTHQDLEMTFRFVSG